MNNDPISQMLTNIRNAQKVKKKYILIYCSKIKIDILNIFKSEGYIKNFKIINIKKNIKQIKIYLKYYHNNPVIKYINKVSKSSLRIYKKKNFIPSIRDELGIVIISTSLGIMTGKKAKLLGLGGEIICYII